MKISDQYRTIGVQNFYSCPSVQKTYQNPHRQFIIECLNNSFHKHFTKNASVLDLGSGNGLVSSALKESGVHNIEGSDKYMHERYTKETGFVCYPYTFEDIADFNSIFEKEYDTIICSYAFDLVPKSYHKKLLYSLSTYTSTLILIRPNSHELVSDIWKLKYKNRTGKSRVTVYQREKALI